jgi:hypothetical protein
MSTKPPGLPALTTPPSPIHVEEVFDAWVLAALDVEQAVRDWAATAPRERAGAHTAYVAALDREEQAADALRLAVFATRMC